MPDFEIDLSDEENFQARFEQLMRQGATKVVFTRAACVESDLLGSLSATLRESGIEVVIHE